MAVRRCVVRRAALRLTPPGRVLPGLLEADGGRLELLGRVELFPRLPLAERSAVLGRLPLVERLELLRSLPLRDRLELLERLELVERLADPDRAELDRFTLELRLG